VKKSFLIALSISIFFSCLYFAFSEIIYLRTFNFDKEKSLDKWAKMVLNGEVEYAHIKKGDEGYVRAVSESACSARYYRIMFNVKKYPYLKWKWKVVEFPNIENAKTPKEKDDYAARVYVIFPFFNFSSSRFLEYVWSEDIPKGTIMTSPHGKNIKVIVVRNGKSEKDTWEEENRNIYEDYIAAFGKKPGLPAGAIAIMCDADGTETKAEALFDEITIRKKEKI